MKIFEKLFHLREKNASLKTEIIGGLLTFVAMCYVLPVIASNMSLMGMNQAGVFAITALLSFAVTLIMALVANLPIVLSCGLGLNAFLVFSLDGDWHQKMILMTVAGLLFFIFSLTPLRKIIIEAIPRDIKLIISAGLGAFILLIGLKGSGIVVPHESTIITLGNFADPAMLIGVLSIFLVIGLMFIKHEKIRALAIPIAVLFSAVVGLITSIILKETGSLVYLNGSWVYDFGNDNLLTGTVCKLPIAPWYPENGLSFGLDFSAIGDVAFFGAFSGNYSGEQFGNDLAKVFSNPTTYVAIFSIVFVQLFDTTATLVAVGEKVGLIDEQGKMNHYHRAVIADATGSLVCGPMGTTSMTSLAESNVGVSLGAKTGLASTVTALLLILSAFIYPVFSIFTAGSVTAPALVGVGLLIISSSITSLDFKNPAITFTFIVTLLFSVLTYSISNGIGFGLIAYCLMMVFQGKAKEVSLPIYIIAGAFVLAFAANTVVNLI